MIEPLQEWGPIPLGLLFIALAGPGLAKLFEYSSQVAFFTELGIPAPELLVPLVGVIELTAALLVVIGVAGRLGALMVIPIMLTAMATAEANALNIALFVAALGILVLGTGRYTVVADREVLESIRGQESTSS